MAERSLNEETKVLAVIPARGGSKTLPNKNLAPIKGMPLVGWTIKAAQKVKQIDKVLVSTNNNKIRDFCKSQGAEVPFLRPAKYSGDSIHSVHVVIHALNWLKNKENYQPDVVLMLLPTSPTRKSVHVLESLNLYLESGADSVIGVCPTSPIGSLRHIRDNRLEPVIEQKNHNFQRQDVDEIYAVNGAIYVSSPKTILEHESFHLPNSIPYVMPKENSIDVNTYEDLKLAEKLL